MDEFTDVNSITNRSELTAIWNYWIAKCNLLNRTNHDTSNIKTYLDKLTIRDKEFKSQKRAKAAKKRADKALAEKLEKDKEEQEFQDSLPRVAEEVAEYKRNKEELRLQIKTVINKIEILKRDMGLIGLQNQLQLLTEKMNEPINTSCTHLHAERNHTFEYDHYYCSDCESSWKELNDCAYA